MAAAIEIVPGYEHRVASHCETGSLRNLLGLSAVEVSEPMVFGIGSGPAFYYLFFARGPSSFPLVGIRNPPGTIFKNVRKLCGVDFVQRQLPTVAAAIAEAEAHLERGTPVAAAVDMYRMKYLPPFMRVHAPFHFIVLVGRQGASYAVSDPYHQDVATLQREDLEAAWATHAPMARDNLLVYLRTRPQGIDWKRASARAIVRTCRDMVLPPGIGKALPFVGVEGMRTYSRAIRKWPARYRGARLREGILFNAVAFEDQGTGGAAFRLMYGAFLQEVGDLFASSEVAELAERLIGHGRRWRALSRRLVVVGRPIPLRDEAFDDWYESHGKEVEEGLLEVSREFLEFADFEQRFFSDLASAVRRLR